MSELDDLLDDLKRRRDELRLQMHLASKELRDEWDELEDKMDEFRRRAQFEETGKGVGNALESLGHELKLGYDRLRKAVTDRE